MSTSPLARWTPWILLLGDVAAVMAFVITGQRDHNLVNEASPVLGVLATTLEFALPWAVAGRVLGAFPRGEDLQLRPLLGRTLNAWLVAAPLGLMIRSFILRRAIAAIFMAATLGFGGLFLFAWRILFALAWTRLLRRA